MSATSLEAASLDPYDDNNRPVERSRPQGIYAVPIVGPRFQQARDITDGLRPTDADNFAQVVAKRTAQASVIAGTAAMAAIIVL